MEIEIFLHGYFINFLLFTPIIIAVIIFQKIFHKKYSATTRYLIWNMLTVTLMIPSNIYSYFLPPKEYNSLKNVNQNAVSDMYFNTKRIFIPNKTALPVITEKKFDLSLLSLKDIFITVWITGAIIYLLFQIIKYFYFRYNVFRWSRNISDENILLILETVKKEQNIKTNIDVKYSYYVNSPLLTGFLCPTIFLPKGIDAKFLNYIFQHELSHYKYCDLILQRIRLVIQSLYWFNPVVWILCANADIDMERACDARVLNFGRENQRKEYANAIFHVISLDAEKSQALTVGFAKNNNEMYNRMEEIMNNKNRKKGFAFIFTVTTVLSLGLFSITASTRENKDFESFVPIPLIETLENLGFEVDCVDENFIKAIKNNKEINFVNEINYNLKKNTNTYFMENSYGTSFVKISVFKDLGYKIKENKENIFLIKEKEKAIVDTECYVNLVMANTTIVEEKDLEESKYYYRHKIAAKNINQKEINDYKIEDVNFMGYNIETLKDYIEANYNKSLEEYKNDLVNINEKYSSVNNEEFRLLDNGLVTILFTAENGSYIMEEVIEVRNNELFVEK